MREVVFLVRGKSGDFVGAVFLTRREANAWVRQGGTGFGWHVLRAVLAKRPSTKAGKKGRR